jgi:hypothetical protein
MVSFKYSSGKRLSLYFTVGHWPSLSAYVIVFSYFRKEQAGAIAFSAYDAASRLFD